MRKQPVSVTLQADNLLWLRGRATALRRRSLSAALDALIAEARRGDRLAPAGARSVVGTIDLAASDPDLAGADADIAKLFAASRGRPADEAGDSTPPRRRARRRG